MSMSPRELYALITWLPEDSAFRASLRGGLAHRGWTTDRILIASLLEQAQWNGYNFIKANSDKKARVTAPKPIQWPGRVIPKKPGSSSFGPIVKSLARGGLPPTLT